MKSQIQIISLLIAVFLVISGYQAPQSLAAASGQSEAGLLDDSCDNCPSKAEKASKAKKSFDSPPAVGTKAICPVMGGEFTVDKDTKRSEHKGRHYVFCCPMCKTKFDANPKKYVDEK